MRTGTSPATVRVAEPKAPFEADSTKKVVIKPKAEKKADEPAADADAATDGAESTEA